MTTAQMGLAYVNGDGQLTVPGYRLFKAMEDRMAAAEATIAAQAATLADHEARITALEP